MANEPALSLKKRDDLARILDDPTFKEAVRIVKSSMDAAAGGVPDANLTVAAAKYHQQAGANKFFSMLEELSRKPKEVKAPKLKQLAKSLNDIKPTAQ